MYIENYSDRTIAYTHGNLAVNVIGAHLSSPTPVPWQVLIVGRKGYIYKGGCNNCHAACQYHWCITV